MSEKRVNLFGLRISDISMSEALSLAERGLDLGKQSVFFTPNLEMLAAAQKNGFIRELLNGASATLPDGAGLITVGALLGRPIKNTVAGIDFGKNVLALADARAEGVFLLGGEVGVAERAALNIKKEHPRINICGVHHGFFDKREGSKVARRISSSGAKILIVCMGFPRQERFVFEHKKALSGVKLFLCLGGALDVWSGDVCRAPEPVRQAHLEWLWRIMNQPKRVGRFISSVPVLFDAFSVFINNFGMNGEKEAYNQTKPDI